MRDRRSIHSLAAGTLFLASMLANALEDPAVNPFDTLHAAHGDASLTGTKELWLDPKGNDAVTSDATLQIQPDGLVYTWSYKGNEKTGELRWIEHAVSWSDSWHQPDAVRLEPVRDHGALLAGEYSYAAGSGPDWHWRIKLARRPDHTLVLQMTNIAPWGEEARAVRMVFRPEP